MKTKKLLLLAALLSPLYCLADPAPAAKTCITCPSGRADWETWISLLPMILFLLVLIVTTIKLRNDKVKLSDLLVEKDPPAPVAGAATPAPSQSISRFIAFLTGMVALVIGVCITSFYMYCYFCDPKNTLDLSKLTNVIWGLGIGVILYGTNKVSAALKSNA